MMTLTIGLSVDISGYHLPCVGPVLLDIEYVATRWTF